MRKILVVEDDPDIAHLIAVHLGDLPANVVVASHGLSGLEHASSGTFDLIVLDIMLPGVDGLEVCRRVRAQSLTVPILIVTARSAAQDRALAREAGADDYVIKPFSVRELVDRVNALFHRTGVGRVPTGENARED